MHVRPRRLLIIVSMLVWLPMAAPERSGAAGPGCPTTHCLYMPAVAQTVPDTTNLPDNWLARLNAYRGAAGVALATEDPSFSEGAAKHVTYMLLNPGEFDHSEIPGHPGYTPEGDQAARQSNLYRASVGFTAANAIDGWMESLYHRYGMLAPELATTGFALGCDSQRCAAVLNVIGGLSDSELAPDGVVYPAPSQRGVQTSLISWQFYPFIAPAVLTSATLRDGNNNPVAITTTSPDSYWNVVSVKPNTPLTPGTTYTAEVHVTVGSRNLSRIWSFQTRSSALLRQQAAPAALPLQAARAGDRQEPSTDQGIKN
jgi:uncharacterized protein YkwD